jgi:hypothetical protein
MRKKKNKSRRKNYDMNKPLMESACIKLGVEYVEFNTNSYRLTKDGFVTVDYFPTSNRCFFHDVKEWGEVVDVRKFINAQFGGVQK